MSCLRVHTRQADATLISQERLWIQCLCRKLEDWRPEPDDEDFEKSAELCFVPGVSKSGADEFDVENLEPVRHGIESTLINNICEEDDPADQWAVPIHPGCFEIFKRMSMLRFGKVDIDGLWKLRTAHGSYENRFTDFPERPDVKLCTEQYHECVRGTEYLAANPIEPLGLQKLINECTGASDEVAFTSGPSVSEGKDPFAQLSFELRSAILLSLDKKDVANLRLASASFVRLPQSYFRHLVQTEMPWLWEVDSLPPGQPIDWHALWIQLSRADGGALLDEQYRKYRQDTIISYRKYDEWHAELERRGIERNDKKYMEVFWQWQDEAENQALEVVRKEKESGRWREKSGRELREIKGLRNRRVIWKDVGEVLRRIEGLESTEQGEGE